MGGRKRNGQRNDRIERIFGSGFGVEMHRVRVIWWGGGFFDDGSSELMARRKGKGEGETRQFRSSLARASSRSPGPSSIAHKLFQRFYLIQEVEQGTRMLLTLKAFSKAFASSTFLLPLSFVSPSFFFSFSHRSTAFSLTKV